MANNFSPKDGGKVLYSEAEKWIKKFDDERKNKEKDPKSVFYGKEFLQSLLELPECAGISFFFAKKHSEFAGKEVLSLVLIPRKADGTLIYSSSPEGKDATNTYVWNKGTPCPPTCS
jgi:hypothetical protein